ncbi:MAG: AsmA-like C-terminal domain-containing protein [Nitrospira sp.]|nr:AsmA-like C-terminal domain-containing protein [Nitrospira sp.]
MSRTRVVVAVIALVVVGGITFLLLSPQLTGADYLKDFFLRQLEQNLGRKIDVHRIKFTVFPRIRLELSQVVIHERNSDQVFLSAKKLDLVLRLVPLLRKQIVGKRLTIEEPTLTLRRNAAGHWNVLDRANPIPTSDDEALELMTRMFRIKEATVIDGTVIVIDEARPDGVRTVKLESVEAALVIHLERNQADVHISADHIRDRERSSLSMAGAVRRADQQSIEMSETTRPPLLFQFEGTVEAVGLSLRGLADFFGPRPVPPNVQGAVTVRSSMRLIPGVAGYDVVMSDLTANLDPLAAKGRASLSGLLTTQPTFSLTFSAPPVQLSDLLKRIPPEWFHPQLPAVIEDRRINGKVEVVSATVTGSYGEGPQLSVTGEFRIREGEALIGDSHVPSKDLSAVVLVEAGRMRVTNLGGRYGTIQMTDSKGLISFLEAGPWMEMEILGTMAASDLLQFLSKTVESEQLSKVLGEARDVEGVAKPTFRLVGPLTQPGGVTFAGGEITAQQVSLSHPSLPERMTDIQGRFVLAEGETQFDQVSGHLGDLTVQVQGGITGGGTSSFRDLLVRVTGDSLHLTQVLPMKHIPKGMVQGLTSVAVALRGLTSVPEMRGEIVLTESKVIWPEVLEKPVGAPATINFEGHVAPKGGLTLTHIEADVPPLRLPVKGNIRLGERVSIDASLATGTVSLSTVPEWITKGGFEAGNVEVSLDVKGKGADWRMWKTNGWLALSNGLVNVRGADGPIQDLYVRLQFNRDAAELKRLSFRLLDSDLVMEAMIRNWATKPAISGKMESNQMDLDLLIPKGERSPMREFLETLAATSRVAMTASITRGHYKHLKFGGLSARITIQDGVLDVDRISGQSTDGEVAGRIAVQLPRHEPAEAEISVRATGVPVSDILRLVGKNEGGVTGEIRITGTIRGHGRNPHGVYPTLNGKADILIENGHIFKSKERVTWKIISILNLPAVLQGKVDLEKEGLPYNKITATVTVRNGLFETENMIIDSPIVKITAAGNYDLPTDQGDMVWAVSPFGSYSQFLKTIPLFGRLFAGDRKGVATAMFSVKGSIEDPEVTYMPMKSFATGLTGLGQLAVDVLKNTVMLPIDLMTPDEDKASPKDVPAPSSP